MNRSGAIVRHVGIVVALAVALLFGANLLAVQQAAAQGVVANPPIILLRDYRFVPIDTTVHVSGGPEDYNLNLTIVGGFGLETGYFGEPSPVVSGTGSSGQEPSAKFVNVHGILVNPISATPVPVTSITATPLPTPGWDLDKTLNLSGLNGSFSASDPNDLFFFGADGQGVAERFEATLSDGWLHLTGGTTDPPSSDSVLYQVNALAHLLPFPDFNGDGAISAADVIAMQQALVDPQAYETQRDLSGADFVAMGDINGDGVVNNADLQALLSLLRSGGGAAAPVPEPASIVLAAIALGGLMAIRRRRPTSCAGAV